MLIRNCKNAEVQKILYSDLNRIFKKKTSKLSGRSVNPPFLSSFLPAFLLFLLSLLAVRTGDMKTSKGKTKMCRKWSLPRTSWRQTKKMKQEMNQKS